MPNMARRLVAIETTKNETGEGADDQQQQQQSADLLSSVELRVDIEELLRKIQRQLTAEQQIEKKASDFHSI